MRWALILIHGYPFDHSLWDAVAGELKNDAKIVAPDLPGFGGTPTLRSQPSLDRYADFIAELMDRERLLAAVVAGMSMGGYVALSFAENYPERLAGLALIASQAAADSDEARTGRAAMIEKVRKEGPQVAAEAIAAKLFSPQNSQNHTYLKIPRECAAKAGVEGICWALQAMANRPDRTFVLKNLECPWAVMHGAEDKIVPIDRAEQMSRESSLCEFTRVANAGHGIPIEQPKILANGLLSLLQRCESYQPRKHTSRPPVTFAPTDKGL